MLGSLPDAEDALQESLLRAWRHLGRFEARTSVRRWLYRITTNVCLSAAARGRPPAGEVRLAPYPDALLDELEDEAPGPADRYELRESVQLAFLAAIQLLPPRQRAVLLLRDVLGWSAGETADLLDSSAASVNSALQRARATLDHRREAGGLRTTRRAASGEVERSLLERYLRAWEAVDVDGLVGL